MSEVSPERKAARIKTEAAQKAKLALLPARGTRLYQNWAARHLSRSMYGPNECQRAGHR